MTEEREVEYVLIDNKKYEVVMEKTSGDTTYMYLSNLDDENDNLILVDYKTDFVKNEQELINEYKVQLEIYKKALSEALKKDVKEVYIYSIHLNKAIKMI